MNGDGQTFAPYHLSGPSLRYGENECDFADGYQSLRRLGAATWEDYYTPYTYPHPFISDPILGD